MWSDKPIEQITLADLQTLVADRVRENRQLDYKDERPAEPRGSNDKKSEFAVDVSALANGSGGLLVYGVAEEREDDRPTGIPAALNGLAGFNLDADGNQLRNYLDSGLDPRLPTGTVELHTIDGGTRGPMLLVRVRRSFSAPHMVRAEGRFRNAFYIRDGARNRQLDAKAVREAMLLAGDWSRRFRSLRQERIGAILADETPVVLDGNRRLVLHVVPVSALEGESRLDPRETQRQSISKQLISFGSAIEYRTDSFNIDGLVISSATREPTTLDYLQVFSSGVLETGDVNYVHGGDGEFPTRALETRLLNLVPLYVDYLRVLGFAPPFIVSLSLLGVKGLRHAEQREIDRVRRVVPTFDRDVVNIPEVVLDAEQLAQPVATYLAPILHGIWQAGGRAACPRYREDGTYDAR